jgi:hypothetical protein
MAPLKKLIITPFFGPLPPWFEEFRWNVNNTLLRQGYDWLRIHDLDDFNRRCEEKLGFKSPIVSGQGKLWDYRCALGLLYEEELKEYDYWATMDYDVVFGNVNEWFNDAALRELDVWSNHHSYVCGFWSLYRNSKEVNELFMQHPDWKDILQSPQVTGWVETEFSRLLERSRLRYKYSFKQGWPFTPNPSLHFEYGRLYQDGEEIAMFHFRRSKRWPITLTK